MKKVTAFIIAVYMSLFGMVANAAIVQATHLDPIGTEVSGDANSVFTWVMPIMGTVLAMGIAIKLLKRFTNKV